MTMKEAVKERTMTMKEAVKERHMVRKYTDEPIAPEAEAKLRARIAENNKSYGLHMALVTGNGDGLVGFAKLLMARGVNNYIILAGDEAPDLDEKLGYCGADLILYAQTLGLNTWWVGGMYSKKGAQKNLEDRAARESARVKGIIAVGYGQTQGVPHKSKTAEEISRYKGADTTNATGTANGTDIANGTDATGGTVPQWFTDGVEALLCAPTALNRQAYTVRGEGRKVSLTCSNGAFSGIDLGIGKYHFEVGAGKENFEWM